MKITQTFAKVEFGRRFESEAYTEDGKTWQWVSNDAVISLDICEEYSIPCDKKSQREAYSEYVSKVISAYRQSREKNGFSAEEMMEARAAHGPGVTLVDVFSGHKFTT